MSVKVPVEPSVLRWALERAGLADDLGSLGNLKVHDWLNQNTAPTINQLKDFAQKTHVPFGMLFLSEPPVEDQLVPDFRSRAGQLGHYSAELADTIMDQRLRQSWYHDYANARGLAPNQWVGSARVSADAREIASSMRAEFEKYNPNLDCFRDAGELRSKLIDFIEGQGFLVSVSGYVGSYTRRIYDPDEFSGFYLLDDYAPLIFVNGQETMNAQNFTVLHELGHLLLGESGVSATTDMLTSVTKVSPCQNEKVHRQNELWCDAFAAYFLVPSLKLIQRMDKLGVSKKFTAEHVEKLARYFCVSTLTILNRMLNEHRISRVEYNMLYDSIREQAIKIAHRQKKNQNGGKYYNTTPYIVGKRFARAVFADAKSSRTTYTEARRLLGVESVKTYKNLAQKIEEQ